ncbi:hypothetical protein LC605_02540 [Nostoc sp. CHAB 5836]|uniref:hypothetical protein n=1 Tax=Nostoc sp. CHAB 5836 TaxID=2780404 RepID=UPI001E55145E|nr:hypothetical protein [Nostoc sp. CHAB 5836]MCC5613972.1 hypothetical protein [Nostoc sp. CHAB 5836]
MQFIKQLGKPLGFVVLIGSAMFSAPSAIAQDVVSTIMVNTDVVMTPAYLKSIFPGATQLDVLQVGGIVTINPFLGMIGIQETGSYSPFETSLYNNRDVRIGTSRGSRFLPRQIASTEIVGIFNALPTNPPLRLDLNTGGTNSPAFPMSGVVTLSGGTTCSAASAATKCVAIHYGYNQTLTNKNQLNPQFSRTVIQLKDSRNTNVQYLFQYPMSSPQVDLSSPLPSVVSQVSSNQIKRLRSKTEKPLQNSPISQAGSTRYLVVYSEQSDPQEPGVVMANWTQFPIEPGQTPRLSFSNNVLNPPMSISNTRVLRTDTQIPLAQLNAIDLPQTDSRFVPVPSANGTLQPGTNTLPANVPPTNIPVDAQFCVIFEQQSDLVRCLKFLFDSIAN